MIEDEKIIEMFFERSEQGTLFTLSFLTDL